MMVQQSHQPLSFLVNNLSDILVVEDYCHLLNKTKPTNCLRDSEIH